MNHINESISESVNYVCKAVWCMQSCFATIKIVKNAV